MPLKMWFAGLTVVIACFALGLWSTWRAIELFFTPLSNVPHAWVAVGVLGLFLFSLAFRQMNELAEDKEDAEYGNSPSHS